jgi:hypothetical protein
MATCVPLFVTADLETSHVVVRRPGGITRELDSEMAEWLLFEPTPGVRYSTRIDGRWTRDGPVAHFFIADPNVALAFKMRFA